MYLYVSFQAKRTAQFRESGVIMSRRTRRRKLSSSSSDSESDSSESWSSSAGESESEEELCDYEKRRLDNIRRNQQMMKSLGERAFCHGIDPIYTT
jgi:hypothetical protein